MKMLKWAFAGATVAVVLCGCQSKNEECTPSFALVTNGVPAAVLVTAPGAEEAARAFVTEAAKCLGGRAFPVVGPEAAPAAGNRIVFRVAAAPYETEDAYRMSFPDARTLEIACSRVSARWAVNRLLTKGLGIVYLSPAKMPDGGTFDDYPKVTEASVPCAPFEQKSMPYWSLRSLDYSVEAWTPSLDLKGVRPPHRVLVEAFDMYGHAEKGDWQEAMLPTYAGKKFHPPAAGKPLPENPFRAIKAFHKVCGGKFWNPCFGNPESATIAISNLVALLRREPARQTVQLDIVDNGGFCECETCNRLNGEKRTSMGHRDCGGSYWRWVNAVAEGVSKVRPDVYLVTFAYREVVEPPPFKLHPRVLVRVCTELAKMTDPATAAKNRDMMRRWADVATVIEMYDYCYGIRMYCLPRNYIGAESAWIREFHDRYHVTGYYAESGYTMTAPFDGPRNYLIAEALRGNETDPWTLAADWCRAAVGPAAAKPLLAYYRFWNDFWTGPEILRTPWFRHGVSRIYLGLGGTAYVAALKRGDMALCRALIDEVVAKADTPDRLRRAKAIEESFRLAEDSATALFAEYVRPEGDVASAADAAALLRSLPEAVRALERLKGNFYAKQMKVGAVEAGQLCNFSLILPYKDNPKVREAMVAAADDPAVPVLLRSILKVWNGARVTNLVPNGSFEEPGPLPTGRCWASRTDQAASDGSYSLGRRDLAVTMSVPVEKGHTYLLLFDAMSPTGSAEGRFHWRVSPWRETSPAAHYHGRDLVLPAGVWQHYAIAVTAGTDIVRIRADFNALKYESDETVLLDNVRVYDLAEVNVK